MTKPKSETHSAAYAMMKLAWSAYPTKSWQMFNHAMYDTLKQLVLTGVKFGPDDFLKMADNMRMERWIGDGGPSISTP